MPNNPSLGCHVTEAPPASVDVDALLVPIFEDDRDDVLLSAATAGAWSVMRAQREFKGKLYEICVLPIAGPEWRPRRLVAIGAGARADFGSERSRRVAAAGALAARQRRLGRVAFWQRAETDLALDLQAIVEGLILASFDADVYKTAAREIGQLTELHVIVAKADDAARAAVTRGRELGDASNIARALANEPGNTMPPSVLADRAQEIASGTKLAVEVLDETQIAALNMGLLIGVGRGSVQPPRLIVLRHEPEDASGVKSGETLALIGKGITFDTGGISIKPAEGMERMKSDMTGGASVIAAMRAISRLGARRRVIGLIPSAENMPGGRAIRPGDVLTAASGKTVEVINTDAEGRLVLADALWYAQQLGATHMIDIATLTGACVVALGKITSGLFATPAWWLEQVQHAGARAGDRLWPMPLFDEYADQLRSDIADIMNVGGRPAGAVTAAMFLKEFAGGRPWAHLDIAGTAWAEEAKPYQPKGPTGVSVRTMAELALSTEEWL